MDKAFLFDSFYLLTAKNKNLPLSAQGCVTACETELPIGWIPAVEESPSFRWRARLAWPCLLVERAHTPGLRQLISPGAETVFVFTVMARSRNALFSCGFYFVVFILFCLSFISALSVLVYYICPETVGGEGKTIYLLFYAGVGALSRQTTENLGSVTGLPGVSPGMWHTTTTTNNNFFFFRDWYWIYNTHHIVNNITRVTCFFFLIYKHIFNKLGSI